MWNRDEWDWAYGDLVYNPTVEEKEEEEEEENDETAQYFDVPLPYRIPRRKSR